MHSQFIATLIVAGALAASPAAAQSPAPAPLRLGSAVPVPVAPQAADQTLGTAILSARLGNDGTLQGGSGVIGASRTALGRYLIAFNRNIENCTAISNHTWLAAGVTSVNYIAGDNYLYVYTFDHNLNDVDAGAKVIVFCSN